MAKACKTCQGRGRYQVRETYTDGEVDIVWYECNDCKGTGIAQDPASADDYDIAGDNDDDDDR